MRDSRDDWRRFDVGMIPSKDSTPHLDCFLSAVKESDPDTTPPVLLDVGCGSGRLARRMHGQGFSVLGVDISPAADAAMTGERHSYFSRDGHGTILSMTLHFTVDELVGLLEEAGFGRISVTTERETSSRRPDEAAYFHYATCRAGR